jgi:hypothetical protein
VVQRELVELPDGDVAPLAPLLDGAAFVNIRPAVDEELVPPRSPIGSLFTARGPTVPLATWTPDEVGFQHGTGVKALERLADAGHPLPAGWRKVSDHPKRGAVLRPPPGADALDALRWLVRAAEILCPLPVIGPWEATVHRR